MKLTAIVVNYNAGPVLTDCLLALLRDNSLDDVRVLDNASGDGSLEAAERVLESSGKAGVRFIRSRENLGYGPAVNRCGRERLTEARAAGEATESAALLVVNPDCIIAPGAVRELQRALENNPRAALAAPLVCDANGVPEGSSLRRFPTPRSAFNTFSGLSRLAAGRPRLAGVAESTDHLVEESAAPTVEAEAVSGACFLLRLDAFEELDGFDESYAMHGEDLDLMYRLAQAGRDRLLVPSARALHRQGISSASRPLWVHWQKHRGMQRFFDKFQGREHGLPMRTLVRLGIWTRWCLTLPLAWWRR